MLSVNAVSDRPHAIHREQISRHGELLSDRRDPHDHLALI